MCTSNDYLICCYLTQLFLLLHLQLDSFQTFEVLVLKYKLLWDSKLSISTKITYLKSEGEISPSLSASKILKAAVQTSSLDSFTVELEWISFWLLVTAWPSIINVTNSKKSTLVSLILDGIKRRCHHRASSFPSIFNHLKWNLSWPFPSWSSFFMNSLLASLLICIFSKAVSTSSQVMLPLNDHVLHCNHKVGCVFPIVIVSMLPQAEFGPNDHWEHANHFTILFSPFILVE